MNSPFLTAESRFNRDLIEIHESPRIKIDLRYSGMNNFMQKNLYQGFHQAFLHQLAYAKFQNAVKFLATHYPGYKFIIFDVLRPRSVQKLMRDFVANTKMENYVADPLKGSMHNFGMAIDLSLQTLQGKDLDMGTDFDDFTELAQPQLEEALLANGLLTQVQVKNRKILREVMESAGFEQLPHEWWHYNALSAEKVRREFLIVE